MRCRIEITLTVNCKHCKNSQEYKPRDPHNIPRCPHTKCSKCSKWINIKRSKLINSDNYQKITNLKLLRKKVPIVKLVKHLKILELLDQGFYAEQINQQLGVSKTFLSRIISSFESRGLIEQIESYPKRYKLTKNGTLILEQGDLNQKRISEFVSDKRKSRIKLPPVRGHKDRFKNELVQKPIWLNSIYNKGMVYGLNIKKVKMNNWEKSLIYFNYNDFNGLDNIEICNNVIVYNFKQKLKDQVVSSEEELLQRKKNLISSCKQARSFLQEKGFVIGQEEPIRCQKPEYGISSNDPRHIGQLGKDILMNIETDKETIVIDDSPKENGEEETDSEQKVVSYFTLPDEVDKVKADLSEMKEHVKQQTLDDTKYNELNLRFSKFENLLVNLTYKIKEAPTESVEKIAEKIAEKMSKIILDALNPPHQEIQVKKDAGGGMYR